jgi:hypothetical protein
VEKGNKEKKEEEEKKKLFTLSLSLFKGKKVGNQKVLL